MPLPWPRFGHVLALALANTLPTTYQRSAKTINTTYQRFACTALPCIAMPFQGYGPKLMFLLISTALKEKGKKNGHTEHMANFFELYYCSQQFSILKALASACGF